MAYYIIMIFPDPMQVSMDKPFTSELAFPTREAAEEHARILERDVDVGWTEIHRVYLIKG